MVVFSEQQVHTALWHISFHWQEHAGSCILVIHQTIASWRKKISLGWWLKVTPMLLDPTSDVSANETWFARTQHGSPSTPPNTKNMPMLIRNRCSYHCMQSLLFAWAVRHTHFCTSFKVHLENYSLQFRVMWYVVGQYLDVFLQQRLLIYQMNSRVGSNRR